MRSHLIPTEGHALSPGFDYRRTAPVSRQKQPARTPTNTVEFHQKHSKINGAYHYPAAHNGLLVASDSKKKNYDLLKVAARHIQAMH
jgi:hypothetical protein